MCIWYNHKEDKMRLSLLMIAIIVLLIACTPTVQVIAPDKPITINLNIKIEHEIRVKIDKELEEIINDDEIF